MGMDNQAEKLEKMIRAFLPGDKVSYEKKEKNQVRHPINRILTSVLISCRKLMGLSGNTPLKRWK